MLGSAPESAPTLPPDRQALEDAQKLKDPQQEIAALRKLTTDFPTSRYVMRAQVVIFDTLLKNFRSRTDAIASQIDAVLAAAAADDRADQSNYLAHELTNAGVLLDRAEALAEDATRNPQTTNTRQRAGYLATLGNVYLKRNRIVDADRSFTEAYRLAPTLTAAAEGVADISLRQHRDSAYDDLARARVTGLLTPEHQRALEGFYAAAHHGSLDGFDRMLDDAYRKVFPPAVRDVQRYAASTARTNRIVLAELFTGSGCPPCAGADAAIDALMERYTSSDVSVLLHHNHVPKPDPMTNPDTVAHAKEYTALGTPMLYVDGVRLGGFAGDRDDAPKLFANARSPIDKALETAGEARVAVSATIDRGIVKVHATAREVKSDARNLALRVALVENQVRYTGENGVRFHPMVVRALATEASMTLDREFNVAAISDALKRYLDEFEQHNDEFGRFSFAEKKHAINARNLTVVAFLQDTTTRHVLQSASTNVAQGPPSASRDLPNPIRWSLTGAPASVRAGATTTVQFVAEIDEGWHLYGLDVPANGPISTEISLAANQPFTLSGPIDAPKGTQTFDANFGVKLELYTGKTTFRLPIGVAAGATAGTHPLVVQARYQSCSNTICLPPRTVKVELPLEVRR